MKPSRFEKTPLKFKRAATLSARTKGDLLVIPFTKGKKKPQPAADAGKMQSLLQHPIGTKDFTGGSAETLLIYPPGQKEPRFLLLGLGEPQQMSIESLRRAFGKAVIQAKKAKAAHINILFPDSGQLSKSDLLRGAAEGLLLAQYQFDGYGSKKDISAPLKEITFIGIEPEDLKKVEHCRSIAKGVYLTQDLVNRNADEVTPQYLVDVARALEEQYQAISTTVYDKRRLEKEKMGLLLAVGRGAAVGPALIICEYRGDPGSKDVTAVVGKGVTYDSGGLNLKNNMLTMKCDMGGAGACLGLLLSAAATRLKQNLTIVIPTTENSIGSKSYKPGDVYISYSGKSVEIGNTDAEGRLILADALSFVCKNIKPLQVIDLATLTGAMVIALGSEYTGMMSNNDALAEQLLQAGEQTYERALRFPLIEEYREKMKSDIADLKNVSGRDAGSIKAALFLQEFVSNIPWAHFDIAGSAFLSEASGYRPKYATGVGVRLLMQFFENRTTT